MMIAGIQLRYLVARYFSSGSVNLAPRGMGGQARPGGAP